MAKNLSPKQQSILRFIRQFIDEHDYPPSIRQIQDGCGISSTSVVDYNLKKLEGDGYIRRDREVSRAIELLERGGRRPRTVAVPIIGQIAAGEPIPVPTADTWSNIDYSESIEITRDMVGGRPNVYGLRVKGSSMIDALVNDGDIVLMEAATTADNGDMVAAWLKREQEATLKRFYQESGRIRLQPANDAMAPIYTDPANVEVQGKVLGAIRSS
ncbi:MAG: LexA family transcriptional regulator [Dehalococcoidia bacterium SM23_28_2]|nr:MAG: LexA family transcriptional regulator [Dehalococcoidia bacterium SM23_28_2]